MLCGSLDVRGVGRRMDTWVCMPESNCCSPKTIRILLNRPHVLSHYACSWLCANPWTVANQAPLSVGFSRQEYWSGLPCLPPGDLPDPRIELGSPVAPALQVDSLPLSHLGNPNQLWLAVYAQSCPALCNPKHCSRPGSSLYGIFQARILECEIGYTPIQNKKFF